MQINDVPVRSILTRTTGFLLRVSSHSLQPYRGCSLGNSLCGVGCYVRHNIYVTRGRLWGSFLESRSNAAEVYLATAGRERTWARKHRGDFSVFLSSSTEPFPTQELRLGVTRRVLEAMCESPPDRLIVQTHSPHIVRSLKVLQKLSSLCEVRCHVSIESDRDDLPGLPRPASTVERRFQAAAALHDVGLRVVVTVSPLLPIANPDAFFGRIAEVADAVVLDHFIGGDGSVGGSRTLRTALPAAMASVDPGSLDIDYRNRMGEVAERHLPGRVGYHIEGFAGCYLKR